MKALARELAACPHCRGSLDLGEAGASCAGCRRDYPLAGTSLNLVPDGAAGPPAHPQQRYGPFTVEHMPVEPQAVMLEIGSGNRLERHENIVTLDVGPGEYVDILGDAHALPFADGSFDFVFSLSVLEHLRNPFTAAKEMWRVLRPGGRVFCDTNFVFPYHSYPNHYFNFSVHGLREVFADFEEIDVGVPPHGTPAYAVCSILEKYRELITDDLSKRGVRTVTVSGDEDYRGWMIEAMEDLAAVHGPDFVRVTLVQMACQFEVDPEAWAAALDADRPEIAAGIREAFAGSPPPPEARSLSVDPVKAIEAILHLPWKKWDHRLIADDAHMISSSVFFHGRRPASGSVRET